MNNKKNSGLSSISILLIIVIILLLITIGLLIFGFYKVGKNNSTKNENATATPALTAEVEDDNSDNEEAEETDISDTNEDDNDAEIAEDKDSDEDDSEAVNDKDKDDAKNNENDKEGTESTDENDEKDVEKVTNGKMVAIDPGHQSSGDSSTEPVGPGSKTLKAKVSSGATGVASGVPEYELNLKVAKKLRRVLIKRGYKVFMIRTKNNVRISNKERATMANNSGSDIYIRIHADGIDDSSRRGVSVLYPSENNPYVAYLSKKSKRLSNDILNAYCKRTGFINRGLSQRDDLTGTNWSKIPVTLIEMGFLSNPEEDKLMQDSAFQKVMAKGIADGIDDYFGF